MDESLCQITQIYTNCSSLLSIINRHESFDNRYDNIQEWKCSYWLFFWFERGYRGRIVGYTLVYDVRKPKGVCKYCENTSFDVVKPRIDKK